MAIASPLVSMTSPVTWLVGRHGNQARHPGSRDVHAPRLALAWKVPVNSGTSGRSGNFGLGVLQGKSKQKRTVLGTGDISTTLAAPLPPRPGTAPAQPGPGPEPGQPCTSPASKRVLAGAGASLMLDDVLEHPHEDEEARASEKPAAAMGSSTQPSTTQSSSHEKAADAAVSDSRRGAARDADHSKTASSADQSADRHKEIRFEEPASSSTSTQGTFDYTSPFHSEASRPFSADVGPSSGEVQKVSSLSFCNDSSYYDFSRLAECKGCIRAFGNLC